MKELFKILEGSFYIINFTYYQEYNKWLILMQNLVSPYIYFPCVEKFSL